MAPRVAELVNPIPVGETPPWARAMATTFLRDPGSPGTARQIDVLTRGRGAGARLGGA